MNINLLKNQHVIIRKLVDEIETQLRAENFVSQAFDLSLKIGQLSGTLVLHLKSEDEFLYPSLMRSKKESLRKIAGEFNHEMGTLAEVFMEYKRTYMLASNIKMDPQKFSVDTRNVLMALKKRLDNEDGKLYPIVE
jgi:hemerythrin superfamily protein